MGFSQHMHGNTSVVWLPSNESFSHTLSCNECCYYSSVCDPSHKCWLLTPYGSKPDPAAVGQYKKPLLDAYQGQYSDKFRYWTEPVLLVCRIILFAIPGGNALQRSLNQPLSHNNYICNSTDVLG